MKRRKRTGIISMLFLGIALILSGCGGSSGGGGGGGISDYTIGGTVNGLSGTVVLQNNGGNNLQITSDGTFSFSTAIADGSTYNVTVKTQPDGQTCTVSNGSGTISGADVTDVTVTCSVDTYTVGGTVSGLSGTVVLQNNGGDDLKTTSDGEFTFSTAIADGSNYSVTVKTQPSGQSCFVTNGSGTVSGANVTDVTVDCYNSGSLDPTFDSNGTVPGIIVSNNAAGGYGGDSGWGITTDANGKILVTGRSWNGSNWDMVIWRYNANGTPDTTFGTDGIVVSNGAAGGNGNDLGISITTDSNRKILVTGHSTNSAGNWDMVIWQYNANGTPDTTFGTDGIVVSNNAAGGNGNDDGISITTDSNGKILVTGESYNSSGNYGMVIWRYKADGTPDTTFDGDGIVVNNNAYGWVRGYSITTDSNGKILVTGFSWNGWYGNVDMVIWRYNANGTLDTTFDTDGIVMSNSAAGGNGNDSGFSITIDANGKILVSGSSDNSSGNHDMVIWQYNANGTLDTTFGTDGIVVSNNAAGGNGNDWGFSITTDSNGKILVAGESYDSSDKYDTVTWRYKADGTPDIAFGTDGIVVSNGGPYYWGNSITTDANGKILVAGVSYNGTDYDMAIWRYIP